MQPKIAVNSLFLPILPGELCTDCQNFVNFKKTHDENLKLWLSIRLSYIKIGEDKKEGEDLLCLPPIGGMLDISPVIAIILLQVLQGFIVSTLVNMGL